MEIQFGKSADIDGWMNLVEKISWNFPGLETKEKARQMMRTLKDSLGRYHNN